VTVRVTGFMLAVNDTRATGFMAECGLNHIERVNE